MATVNTTEILGSDSISGSRVTINSNFLILQNWINGFVTVFGVDSVNGIMDLSAASTGKIMAKIGAFNSIQVPSIGVSTASINSSGQASFSTVSTGGLTASSTVTLSGNVTVSSSGSLTVGATASFNSNFYSNSGLYLGVLGHVVSQNTTYLTGLTAGSNFPANSAGGGGYNTANMNSPYALTGLEDVIYANCAGPTGFYIKVVDGVSPFGGTVSNLPAGTRLTIINTSGSTGYIWTGVTGSPNYYTGFNTDSSYGSFPVNSTGIIVNQNSAYRSSVQLQWEPRIALNQATESGSWVVLSSTNMVV